MNQHSPSLELDPIFRVQEYYDQILREVGVRAPQPTLGQSVRQYRQEALRSLKYSLPEDHPLRQVNFRGLRSDSLDAFEPQVFSAFKAAKVSPAKLADGELKAVPKLNAYGIPTETRFIGKESFVKFMGRPGRRVVNFMRPAIEPILARREIG